MMTKVITVIHSENKYNRLFQNFMNISNSLWYVPNAQAHV